MALNFCSLINNVVTVIDTRYYPMCNLGVSAEFKSLHKIP